MPKNPPGGRGRRKSAKAKKATSKRPAGRPSSFSPALADEICRRLADGESLRKICDSEGMPVKETVRTWLREKPEFLAQYAQAREEQADTLAAEILEIADDTSKDYIQTEDGPRLDSEAVQRSKLRVDARKWYASKLAPKKYGERQELEHSGQVKHEHTGHLTLAEFDQRMIDARA